MSTGLKVWLWIVLVLNAITLVTAALGVLVAPILLLSVVLEAGIVAGACLLLFKQQKMGLYIICGCEVLALIVNIVLGENIITSILSAVIMPGIIYLLMKPNWDSFN